MRHAILALVATLVAATTVSAAQPNYRARVAAAVAAELALKEFQDQAPVVPPAPTKASVCPCSRNDDCRCIPGRECGCLTAGQYRWVRTSDQNQTALYKGDVQFGNWWHQENEFKLLLESAGEVRWVPAPCPVNNPPPTKGPVHHHEAPLQTRQVYVPAPTFTPTFAYSGYGGYGGGRGGFRGGNCGPSG